MKDGIIVTIDGPSAAGKSSVARLLARRLGFLYLDSGALYRAIGWKALKEGISIEDKKGIERICKKIRIDVKKMGDEFRIMVDHMDITEEIRG
ncbi:MAG: (d)CMP kinase, partial [Nitrospirota bacterium]